jgi:hypothetical protein
MKSFSAAVAILASSAFANAEFLKEVRFVEQLSVDGGEDYDWNVH